MRLKNEIKCDVLVMGAGIAGIMAAISAAEAGADVCITSGTCTVSYTHLMTNKETTIPVGSHIHQLF